MINRFKMQYYGLRYYYLVFILGFTLLNILSLTILNEHSEYLIPILFIIILISIFLIGVYEYSRIANMHSSILVNKKTFFNSSLVFGLINILISLAVFYSYLRLVNEPSEFNILINSYPGFYPMYFIFMIFSYTLGNLYGLIYKKDSKVSLFICFLFLVSLVYFKISFEDIINFTNKLIKLNVMNLDLITLCLLVISLLLIGINKLIFKNKS